MLVVEEMGRRVPRGEGKVDDDEEEVEVKEETKSLRRAGDERVKEGLLLLIRVAERCAR